MTDQQDEFIRNNHWFDQLLKERIIFSIYLLMAKELPRDFIISTFSLGKV